MVDLVEFTSRCDRYNIQPSFDNLIVRFQLLGFAQLRSQAFTDIWNLIASLPNI
ncbi:hypothetical protein KBT16_08635 [Nostoc sp. CCCryo 231-06]|nr:hypothetical protein [Nostoc sp. CCCryo 231-06]